MAGRHKGRAAADHAHEARQRSGDMGELVGPQRDHRRGEHDPFEPAAAMVAGGDDIGAAHRMAEREIGRRAIRQHHLRHEGVEVDGVLREVLDVALVVVGERALREALPAPVEGHDRETARAQIAHRLEIFFNVFGAALQDDDGAPAARRRLPAAKAQSHPVRGLEDAGQPVIGHRIGGNRDEFHDAANKPLDEGYAPYRA